MTRRISAIFKSSVEAHQALKALQEAGFEAAHITMQAGEQSTQHAHDVIHKTRSKEIGAIVGIMLGGPAGTVLGLLFITLIWGTSAFVVNPSITAAIFAVGSMIGAIIGAAIGYKLPDIIGKRKAPTPHVRREGAVITLDTDTQTEPSIREILHARNAVTIE